MHTGIVRAQRGQQVSKLRDEWAQSILLALAYLLALSHLMKMMMMVTDA